MRLRKGMSSPERHLIFPPPPIRNSSLRPYPCSTNLSSNPNTIKSSARVFFIPGFSSPSPSSVSPYHQKNVFQFPYFLFLVVRISFTKPWFADMSIAAGKDLQPPLLQVQVPYPIAQGLFFFFPPSTFWLDLTFLAQCCRSVSSPPPLSHR